MHWSDKYIGLPYKDHNCAEFVALIARDHFDHDIVLPKNVGKFLRAQQKQIQSSFYEYVQALPILEPEEGAVCLMHGRRRTCHIGIVIFINKVPYVLHSITGCNQVVRHKVTDLHKYQLEVEGFYLWQR